MYVRLIKHNNGVKDHFEILHTNESLDVYLLAGTISFD